MKIYLYITTILLLLLLINLWLFYTPSFVELILTDWIRLEMMPVDVDVILMLSNSVFSIAFMCMLFVAYLFWRRDLVGSLIGLLALLLLLFIDPLKNVFQRPRPLIDLDPLDAIAGFGFPSGHAIMSIVLLGVLAMLYRRFYGITSHSRLVLGVVAIYAIIIGWTRIQLGVHYLSDVLAGYAIGILVLLALARLDAVLRSRF